MTDDEILELAKDAWSNGQWCFSDRGLLQFARAIAEREREDCVRLCAAEADEWGGASDGYYAARNAAVAIKERGEK